MKNSHPVITILAVLLSVCMLCACTEIYCDYVYYRFFVGDWCDDYLNGSHSGNTNQSQGIVSFYKTACSFIKKNEKNLKLYETFNAVGNIQLRSAKTKYKYKKTEPEQAKQGWTMKGEFDTSLESFNKYTPIRIQAGTGTGGAPHQINHQFTPDKVSKNGKSCKAKFKYSPSKSSKNGITPKSFDHNWPSYGMFSGRIKKGKIRYAYNIKKAREAGQMENGGFDDIKNSWANSGETSKVEVAGFVHAKVKIGVDEKKADSMMKVKATKKGVKGKVKPSEQF